MKGNILVYGLILMIMLSLVFCATAVTQEKGTGNREQGTAQMQTVGSASYSTAEKVNQLQAQLQKGTEQKAGTATFSTTGQKQDPTQIATNNSTTGVGMTTDPPGNTTSEPTASVTINNGAAGDILGHYPEAAKTIIAFILLVLGSLYYIIRKKWLPDFYAQAITYILQGILNQKGLEISDTEKKKNAVRELNVILTPKQITAVEKKHGSLSGAIEWVYWNVVKTGIASAAISVFAHK